MKSWLTFLLERFPVVSHLTMILLFVGSHVSVIWTSGFAIPLWKWVCVFLSILVFFFKMRIYDEIKDFDLDKVINPQRPLPRGLLQLSDMYKGIVACIVLEVLLFLPLGLPGIACLLLAIAYSLLMYKEFFMPNWIRPHLTTYAMSHTVVTFPMGIAIFSGLSAKAPWEMPLPWVIFAVGNWPLFNIFEFGRKTFASSEERKAVESYSKVFGRYGAVLLVLLMSVFSIMVIESVIGAPSLIQRSLFLVLNLIGFTYAFKNAPTFSDVYRKFSSGYIVLFYVFYLAETLSQLQGFPQ